MAGYFNVPILDLNNLEYYSGKYSNASQIQQSNMRLINDNGLLIGKFKNIIGGSPTNYYSNLYLAGQSPGTLLKATLYINDGILKIYCVSDCRMTTFTYDNRDTGLVSNSECLCFDIDMVSPYKVINVNWENSIIAQGTVASDLLPYLYLSEADAISALGINKSITYRDTNCTHSGPDTANTGATVTVRYTFPDGYGIANNSDIYVTNNGVIIPSTYANGTLTFTMPE